MDRPILALTRARPGVRAAVAPHAVAARNMRLLVQLRWIAVGGQLLTILAVHFGLGLPLPMAPMLAVVAVLAVVNPVVRRISYSRPIGQEAILAALLLDVAALAIQLYFSGGAANPFISLFLLQLVLGAILLEPPLVAILGVAMAAAFVGLSIDSVPLTYPPHLSGAVPRLQAFGAWLGFVMTGGLLVVFVERVIHNLRARDAYLAELSQRAAEEEGIVRMGLLASGAAHELGTPLSSLSVVLNDWSRMPRLARDPELAGELAEMQREVGRCKTIVGDILHSVGNPRGEELALIEADDLLGAVAANWRAVHPAIPLIHDGGGLDGAAVVAEPALPQVIASLLENAAEVSPGAVYLSGGITADGLEIRVADDGPGFAPDTLAAVGRPYQSTKGAGRGLGLFLAAALARRLGGR
ncbi:MAG: HAMP domain-containing histidine kinase, partial [Brevundimonas sp.]|uniref:ATP-binding protein n=1 Tax=Brevundimonas sp. TaxID=1871086 RepID=UPI0025C6530A